MVLIGVYCRNCRRFVRHGADGGPLPGIEWIPICDWCQDRQREEAAQVAQLEALWAARTCAADDCDVVFTPAATQQRFCSDRCRRRSHARAKAAAAAAVAVHETQPPGGPIA